MRMNDKEGEKRKNHTGGHAFRCIISSVQVVKIVPSEILKSKI